MGKEKRSFCCHQNFVPNVLSAPVRAEKFLLTSKICPSVLSVPALGLYTCIKSFKMCLKSYFKEIVFVLLVTASKTHIGFVLFRTSAYTGAKQASRVPFWFRDLSRQNYLVPGHLVPYFRPCHLVPLFGSPRSIFYNGV